MSSIDGNAPSWIFERGLTVIKIFIRMNHPDCFSLIDSDGKHIHWRTLEGVEYSHCLTKQDAEILASRDDVRRSVRYRDDGKPYLQLCITDG